MSSIICPKCGKEQPAENDECIQCGIIFSKIKEPVEQPETNTKDHNDQSATPPNKDNPEPKNSTLKTGLITCPACHKKFSETIDTCVHCGLKLTPEKIAEIKSAQKKTEKGCMTTFIVIFVLIFTAGYWVDLFDGPKDTRTKREKMIEKAFNNWDGSHIELTKIIKATMNDPDSYKHVETKYSDKGDYLIVKTTFRGKNAFGGVVTNWISAKCGLNGKVIEITGQGPYNHS